ncbi:TrbI/VirB10 family protein [Massilia sp. LjRoot122]|uniref:TrbI/VirB10 family protein n=1 Tax=Massilia sp. LjRoot122 TaxID=3342257 RepID=UPI003ED16047
MATNKDPFETLPTLEPEPQHESGPAPTFGEPAKESAEDIASSAPPRNLIKTATKYAVPIIVGSVIVWLFYTPDNPQLGKRVAQEQISVDTAQQTATTASMYQQMKAEAAKPKPVVVPVMPGSPAGAQSPSQSPMGSIASPAPTPPNATTSRGGYVGANTPSTSPAYGSPSDAAYRSQAYTPAAPMPTAMSEEVMREAEGRRLAQLKREEEIRSAPLEAGQVRLMGQGGASDASKSPAALAEMQSDLTGDRERDAALRSQQALQEQMLAAMTPKEAQKSRGTNEEFLAGAAASATTRAQLASLQSAAGRYLVGEGAVIRAVLLTNVNSDLPGRILARITSDVYDSTQRFVVIPKGSLINGVYNSQVIVGQERLLMAMTRLTLPNGNWIPLTGNSSTDMMGTSGVGADVDNHFMKMFGSSLVIGATSLLLPRQDTSVTTLPGTTGGNGAATAGSVFATTLNDVLKSLLDRNKNIAPTLRLFAGQEFIFMANQDMLMAPYH